jgi:Flp pilus assembly pilin Flp
VVIYGALHTNLLEYFSEKYNLFIQIDDFGKTLAIGVSANTRQSATATRLVGQRPPDSEESDYMSSNKMKKQKGQGMVEYIVIVAMVALAAIGAYSYFGDTVRAQTGQMANEVAGQTTNTAGTDAANAAATSAATEAAATPNLSNYNARDTNR